MKNNIPQSQCYRKREPREFISAPTADLKRQRYELEHIQEAYEFSGKSESEIRAYRHEKGLDLIEAILDIRDGHKVHPKHPVSAEMKVV